MGGWGGASPYYRWEELHGRDPSYPWPTFFPLPHVHAFAGTLTFICYSRTFALLVSLTKNIFLFVYDWFILLFTPLNCLIKEVFSDNSPERDLFPSTSFSLCLPFLSFLHSIFLHWFLKRIHGSMLLSM